MGKTAADGVWRIETTKLAAGICLHETSKAAEDSSEHYEEVRVTAAGCANTYATMAVRSPQAGCQVSSW